MTDSLYSVFQKFCPQCTASVSRDADRCGCGHAFNGGTADDSDSPLAQAIAEEKLYEDYLQARVTQTAQAAIAAQTLHQSKPQDGMFALAARNAMEEAERCRAELDAQRAKVAEMERALEAERRAPQTAAAHAPVARPQSIAEPIAAPMVVTEPETVTITPVAAVDLPLEDIPATTVTREVPRPAASPITAKPKASKSGAAASAEVATAAIQPHVHEPPRVLKSQLTERVATAAEALRAELAQMRAGRESSLRKSTPVTPVKTPTPVMTSGPAVTPAVPAPPTTSATPRAMPATVQPTPPRAPVAPSKPVQEIIAQANAVKKEKREAAQAAKAQKIREARLARQAQRPPAATPTRAAVAPSTAAPAPATPAAAEAPLAEPKPAAARSARSVRVQVTPAVVQTKECANCTAAVALSTRRCRCGYDFPDEARVTMPALALDPKDAAKVIELYHRRR